mgnify:CR=1 FL=1|jgi:hypothetical protein
MCRANLSPTSFRTACIGRQAVPTRHPWSPSSEFLPVSNHVVAVRMRLVPSLIPSLARSSSTPDVSLPLPDTFPSPQHFPFFSCTVPSLRSTRIAPPPLHSLIKSRSGHPLHFSSTSLLSPSVCSVESTLNPTPLLLQPDCDTPSVHRPRPPPLKSASLRSASLRDGSSGAYIFFDGALRTIVLDVEQSLPFYRFALEA